MIVGMRVRKLLKLWVGLRLVCVLMTFCMMPLFMPWTVFSLKWTLAFMGANWFRDLPMLGGSMWTFTR